MGRAQRFMESVSGQAPDSRLEKRTGSAFLHNLLGQSAKTTVYPFVPTAPTYASATPLAIVRTRKI